MKNSRNSTLLLTLILLISTACAEVKTSNCDKKEEILFSCSTGKKIISFCASPKDFRPAYLEYRFGTPKMIELSYKVVEHDSVNKFSRAEVLGASSSSTEIWFENNGVNYVLGDPVKGDAALEIVKQKKIITRLVCKKDFLGDTSMPSVLIEQQNSSEFFKLYGIEKQ
jgi:hypothetical protein